jgi:hypothetical protein
MKRRILLALPVVAILGAFTFVMMQPAADAQAARRWHMHIALDELKEAHKELKTAPHNFGGHREKALLAIDEAIIQLEKAIPFIK